ncbi:MAG: hypothetical protein R2764_00970 [Bacteroidales bacterium]
MKNKKVLLITLGILFLIVQVFSQVDPYDPNYQNLKETGQLPPTPDPEPYSGEIPTMGVLNTPIPPPPTVGLLIPWDPSFTLAMPPNDDGYTNELTFPFSFCFYDTYESSCWINNNGNVSFDGPYSSYTPSGFPLNSFAMLAPFWADVDTRTCGQVWYKTETSPNRMIVIWSEVGYFSQNCEKLNTFELIFTDGNDPLIGIGNTVAFSYDDMQWTTGDASSGTGGFGGSPATVGINKGNGVDFALVGRFDHPGSDYDGPGGNPDGVDFLDNQVFVFNTCNVQNNIPPVPVGFPAGTVTVYVGDTYNLQIQFLGPEIGQTVTTVVNDGGLTGFSYTTTPGNPSVVGMQLIASVANLGTHTIQFSATDDGIPVGVTNKNLVINVVQQTAQVPLSNWAVFIAIAMIGLLIYFKGGKLFG